MFFLRNSRRSSKSKAKKGSLRKENEWAADCIDVLSSDEAFSLEDDADNTLDSPCDNKIIDKPEEKRDDPDMSEVILL